MPDSDGVAFRCFDDRRLFLYITDSQDGNLGLVDDWCSEQVLECSEVRDCEGASLNIVRREFVVACLVCQGVYGDSQAVQVQLVGVANNRDNQISVIQRDCDSYIDMFLQNDLVAVDGGVYLGKFGQGFCCCLRNGRHISQADAFPFPECLLVA